MSYKTIKALQTALTASFLIACSAMAQQKDVKITFKLHSPDLPDTVKVYICGGMPQLADWNPSGISMKPEGNHTWSKQITVSSAQEIEYKYTLGSWEREGGDANGLPLSNFHVSVKRDTVINDNVFFWLNGSATKRNIPHHITGTVRYYTQFTGKGLKPRDIIIWLPPGYDSTKSERYPVLYMHDGQNIFDPATSSFGVEWRVDETCDSLIKAHVIPPLIVVGIYNTVDRTIEYTPGPTSDAYMDFVVHKVKPFIDSVYPTRPGRINTFVGGSSYGGLISFMLAWNYPDVFSHAICMSPAFVTDKIDYVKVVKDYTGPKKNITFYIDNGAVGLDALLQTGDDLMMKALAEKGYKEGRDYTWVFDPKAKHFEADWAKRFPGAIESCFTK